MGLSYHVIKWEWGSRLHRLTVTGGVNDSTRAARAAPGTRVAGAQ